MNLINIQYVVELKDFKKKKIEIFPHEHEP